MKHKHADNMAAYAADAQTTEKPWELWEAKPSRGDWFNLASHPSWADTHEYRRKTNEQIIHVLLWQAHEQLEEISAEICALNLDGIQDLLAQVRELVKGGEV
jgi:hypothetical protein